MTLKQLLEQFEIAVAARDHSRALDIAREITQRLQANRARDTGVERHLRAALAQLEALPKRQTSKLLKFDPIILRGTADEAKETVIDDRLYPVWFGTNRRPRADGNGFSGERHHQTTLGQVTVRVPAAHRFGEVGSGFWSKLKRFDFRDDSLRVHGVTTLEAASFYDGLQARMRDAEKDGQPSHALFFLHGFNTSFDEAAIRAAQLGCDLAVPGATAFFSWPSQGSALAYPEDEASIEASERSITDFLVDFARRCGARKIHVIAHSMGNRGLLRALQRIAAKAETKEDVRFDQIFLAAPDIDRDLFLDLASLYPRHSERTTLYASNADLPVHLSAKLHNAPRAGYFTPYTVTDGIDTIAVPDFDVDMLGHTYFAQAEALLHDIHDLMRHGEPPSRRQRLEGARHEGADFWAIRR